MRKQLFPLLLIALLCSGVSTAQVRQNIKIMDYGSGQPLAGVQVRCAGQTQTTNAKGLAVFTFPGKAYGDFVDMNIHIERQGFVSVGRDWNSRKLATDVLSKETLTIYMTDAASYTAERERLFDSLHMHHYREITSNLLEQAASEVAADPDEASEWSSAFAIHQNMYSVAWSMFDNVAEAINPPSMHYISKDIRKACEKALSDGDLKGCLALARAQIADNDSSEENLQRIYYYLTIHDAAEDTTPASKYYKILFDHGFNKNSGFIIDYMNCLGSEDKDKEVEALKTYAKDNCKDNYMKQLISRPHTGSTFDSSMEAGVAEALTKVRIIDEISPKSEILRSHYRRIAAYYLLMSGDTVQANRQLDTAIQLLDRMDKNDFTSELEYLLETNDGFTGLVQFPDGIDSALAAKIIARHVATTGRIYSIQPTLSSRVLHYYALKNSLKQYDSATVLRISEMDRMLPELQRDMPEVMYPEQLRIKELLLQGNMVLEADKESITRCFNEYKAALPPCEKWHPYMYAYGLNTNFEIKQRCYKNGNLYLIGPLDTYTDELLEKKARILQKDSFLVKAMLYNNEAEMFYSNELYEQSLASYDKSISYYRKSLPTNDSLWMEILTAMLQKGDAYMRMEQLPEAFNCYQQVLDYEKQMPAHLKVPYTINKAIALYFQADLFTMQQDYKKAMKYYNLSEKVFKQVEKAGDTTFYDRWGEMHYNKAFAHYYAGQQKQCMEELKKAEKLYDKYPLQKLSRKYEKLKSILTETYEENNQYNDLLLSLTFYFNYCDSMKYRSVEHYNEYVHTAIRLGNLWSDYQVIPATLRYYNIVKNGLDFLMDYGGEKDERYLQTLLALGKQYRMADSIETAMDYFRQSLKLNSELFEDNDPKNYTYYDLSIKRQMIKCYDADSDTLPNSTMKDETLNLHREIISKLSTIDTNIQLRRTLAYHHRLLGAFYTQIDWPQMALSQFDSCLEIMLPMYRDGDRAETEEDIARSYFSSATVYYYMLDDRDEKSAKENLDKCLEICENAVDPDNLAGLYYYAVSMKLEMLADPFATKDEAAIKKYRKIKTALEKKLK